MRKTVCVIPARMESTRFPGKMLAPLGGKPLVTWAYEAAKFCGCFDDVVVATDSKAIADVVLTIGAKTVMTDPACESGTDRLVEVQKKKLLRGDVWVNWQGDEPFISKEAIEDLLQSTNSPDQEIWTLKKTIDTPELIAAPSVVKVVTDFSGRALFFSRSPIPSNGPVFQHVGLYAYRDTSLKKIGKLSPSPLERAERLEQLRFLENGLSIHVHPTSQEIFGIDTKEELAKAETMCYNRG